MNTHDIDIELPPLPRPQVPRIDADIDLMDIRRLANWCEKTANEHARAIEQAVMQSEQVQAWKRDALRFQKIMCMTRAEREEVLFFACDRDVINAIDAVMEKQK